jgi:long-subunit acyl-CoA synthetase (AMP-forming)
LPTDRAHVVRRADLAARDRSGADLDRSGTGADPACVIFTSGSTGWPKGAMIEHVGMMNHPGEDRGFPLDRQSVVG